MYVCVCLFVYCKKGSVPFDVNNTRFTQKIGCDMLASLFRRDTCVKQQVQIAFGTTA